MKDSFKFKKGDRVLIKPGTAYMDAIAVSSALTFYSFSNIMHKPIPGLILTSSIDPEHSAVYLVRFQNTKLGILTHVSLPEQVLQPYIKLTPKTDEVFRDILRGI